MHSGQEDKYNCVGRILRWLNNPWHHVYTLYMYNSLYFNKYINGITIPWLGMHMEEIKDFF